MKRFFVLFFITLLAFLFVGCNNKSNATIELAEDDKNFVLILGEERTVKVETGKGVELLWSSNDEDVAKVEQGKITAIGVGNTKINIQIKDTDVKESIRVTVVLPEPTEVVLASSAEVVVGESIQLDAEVKPALANQTVEWSSEDSTIATVDNTGIVTGKKDGIVKIIATSVIETIKNEITVTVVNPNPTGITISGLKEVFIGKTTKYKAIITPSLASQEVTWSVSNNDIAVIDQNGNLTAKAIGKVKVIATSNVSEIGEEFEIEVKQYLPTIVNIEGPALAYIDRVAEYTANVSPNEADQQITWSVNDTSKATIDQDGKLTPLATGVVTVRATSILENIFSEIEVTLAEFIPTDIIITGNQIAIIGEVEKYSVYVLPEGINQEVTWTVSDEEIATISLDGTLTPLKEGKVTLIATSVQLTTITAEYTILIKDAAYLLLVEALADGKTAQYPGGNVSGFLYNFGFSGYTMTHGGNKVLYYGYNSYISLREMLEGETVLPWQVVQPHTTGDKALSNYGLRLDGPVKAGPESGKMGTGVIYHNANSSDVVVKSKELYGYQNPSAWGYTTYGIILVDSIGLIIENYDSNSLAEGMNITIPAGHYLLTIFQEDRNALGGSGEFSFAQHADFAVGKSILIEFHEDLILGK